MDNIEVMGTYMRETFVMTQVSAERLAYKTLSLTGKTKLRTPNIEDMTRRYMKLYDDMQVIIGDIDSEDTSE